ncbi:MAG: prepilin peptidase [Acidobacteria bacterium]|nr:prepilin peptidase [Acidobacteriota bacterium]
MNPFETCAVVVGLVACATDISTRRVPNVLTGLAVVCGLAAHTLLPSGHGLTAALLGCAAGLAAFFPFFALGGMGGGDVKLMAALGTWIGWSPVLWTALYGAVAGGVLGLIVGFAHGYLRQAFSNIGTLFLVWRVQGVRPVPELTLEHGRGPRLPYALPIFVGLVTTLWRH